MKKIWRKSSSVSSLESQTTRYSELEIAKRNKQPCEIVSPAFLHTGINVSTILGNILNLWGLVEGFKVIISQFWKGCEKMILLRIWSGKEFQFSRGIFRFFITHYIYIPLAWILVDSPMYPGFFVTTLNEKLYLTF